MVCPTGVRQCRLADITARPAAARALRRRRSGAATASCWRAPSRWWKATSPADGELAARLLDAILPHTGKSRRVGITGVPGVGKSTFIDALGMHLIRERGERVAVLSVDPSSPISRRQHPGRQDPHGAAERGGAAPSSALRRRAGTWAAWRAARAKPCCCARPPAIDNVLVETVGVGQSETAVRSMTDFFLLLMLAGAGDELQGMKRGIIEMIDGMAINKADGDNRAAAERARVEYASALHLFPAPADGWTAARGHLLGAATATGIARNLGDGAATPRAHGWPAGHLARAPQRPGARVDAAS